jgi:L-methionine (R)-S-oxide reductase
MIPDDQVEEHPIGGCHYYLQLYFTFVIMIDKEQSYIEAIKEIKGVIDGEEDLIANLSNTVAILKEKFNFWWIGFYLVKKDQLVLGPFQGPVACTRISIGKGVCGTSWQQKQTIVVADVHQFPGHIACNAASNSEIVVPVLKNNEVVMVLDADSEHYDHFNEVDKKYLEEISVLMCDLL